LYTNFGFILFFSHSELFLVIFNRFYSSLLWIEKILMFQKSFCIQ
jgi:hypothetical protein